MYDEIDLKHERTKWYWIGCAAGAVGMFLLILAIGIAAG